MKLRNLPADFQQAIESPFVQIFAPSIVCGDSQNVEVHKIVRLLRPKRLKVGNRLAIVLGKKMAQSQEIAGLLSIRLLAHNGSERLNGPKVVAGAVFDQANIQANAR